METNLHHIWWQRKSYRTPVEKRFRSYSKFVIPMEVSIHDDLHAELRPPTKPRHDEMLGALDLMEECGNDPVDNVLLLSEYFLDRGRHTIGRNLIKQASYLMEGAVILGK